MLAATRSGARRTAAIFQRFIQINARRSHCGDEAEYYAGQKRDARGEREDSKIDPYFAQPRDVFGAGYGQSVNGPDRYCESNRAARKRKQHAFGDQLPHKSSAACADGRANRDFFLARSSSREL